MWAIAPLAVSAIGIILLVLLKAFELRQQRVMFGRARAAFDARVNNLFSALRGDMPHKGKLLLADVLHHGTVHASGFALHAIRFIERRLARFVNMVKGRRQLRGGGKTQSAYLRNVTNHRNEVRRQNGYHPKP